MPPSARQPGRWVTLNWTFKHLNVNLWAKSASEELDNTIAMQCCESSSCIKEICFTVFPIGNSSHSDQVKQLTNMSVNLSLKALKEMDYWKEHNSKSRSPPTQTARFLLVQCFYASHLVSESSRECLLYSVIWYLCGYLLLFT